MSGYLFVPTIRPLDRLARCINEQQAQIEANARNMLFFAKVAGELLIEVKKQLPHGQFKAWIEVNTKVSYRQAAKYMQIAKSAPQGTFDPGMGINAFLEQYAQERPTASPKSNLPTFTEYAAEYALKIATRPLDGSEKMTTPAHPRPASPHPTATRDATRGRHERNLTMNTELNTFTFKTHNVRTVTIEGEPWFVAKDVFDALGYPYCSHGQVIGKLEGEGVSLHPIQGSRRSYPMTIINEPGLYKIILRSDKPQAKPFQDWVTKEVLPAIRKTGSYSLQEGQAMPLPSSMAEVLRGYAKALLDLATSEEEKANLSAQVERLTPKAKFVDELIDREDEMTMKEAAGLLKTGEQTLRFALKDAKVLFREQGTGPYMPYAEYVKAGYFRVSRKLHGPNVQRIAKLAEVSPS
ncbi:BRO family protein [Magnetospirillum fulvum]|uniref:BRO family protein n=1 Tax=Magnetospirillum fulvum TaxID=1082 RepID=UPI00147DCC7B|nr:BRO family protein [Magnetospirillum fulvum]